MGRTRLRLLIAAVTCLAMPALGDEVRRPVWSADPATGCRFELPRTLAGGNVFWMGDCPRGRASGLGMLRRRDGNTAGAAFFGELKSGVPTIGVIQVEGGYEVGRYRDGDLTSARSRELDFPERLDAFRTAAQAARAVAAKFVVIGNERSAAFYANIARQLDEQEE